MLVVYCERLRSKINQSLPLSAHVTQQSSPQSARRQRLQAVLAARQQSRSDPAKQAHGVLGGSMSPPGDADASPGKNMRAGKR